MGRNDEIYATDTKAESIHANRIVNVRMWRRIMLIYAIMLVASIGVAGFTFALLPLSFDSGTTRLSALTFATAIIVSFVGLVISWRKTR